MHERKELAGRLIKVNKDMFFLCMDGTVAIADDIMLIRIFTGFREPEKLSGNHGIWNRFGINMEDVPGETLAYIWHDMLHIQDSSAFNSLLSMVNPNEYISVSDYAKKNERSVSRIKKLCSENRIPGAIQMGGQWFIPKKASYPVDNIRVNKRPDK